MGQFAMSPAVDGDAWQQAAAGTNIKATICQVSASEARMLARARKRRMITVMVHRAVD